MNFGLPKKILIMMQSIFQQHPEITRVQIFGSRAIGNYRPHSDIDLVISGNINDALLANIASALEELPVPYLFDIKNDVNITHQGLREHIRQFGKNVYVKPI